MDKIAIHGRGITQASLPYVHQIVEYIRSRGTNIVISESVRLEAPDFFSKFNTFSRGEEIQDFKAILSLGGDGTLLDTLSLIGRTEIPILGINLGRLGFLATISKEKLSEALARLFNGEYEIENRSLVELSDSENNFLKKNYALNEFAILRKDTSSMIVVKSYLNGEFLNTYWADGLMVSTPTGSTGYSLSCGGPVLMPNAANLVITPVSPHNLNVRPLVIPDDTTLTFEVETRDPSYLVVLDSRSISVEKPNLTYTVSKANFFAKLIKIKGDTFIDTLRTKLTWGLDKRNNF